MTRRRWSMALPPHPARPGLAWDDIFSASNNGTTPDQMHIQLDTWNTMMQVTGITLWEDPNHPESWLRDATLDYWNVSSQSWVTGPALLSDQATHSHAINPPIQTPRVRVSLATYSPINTRLGEIVLNGSLLGCSHPDVVAGHNTCVLFDQNTWPFTRIISKAAATPSMSTIPARTPPARCAWKRSDTNFVYTDWDGACPFFYMMPDWNFNIMQTPQNANEFRYLQFAWKAVDPNVTGMDAGSRGSVGNERQRRQTGRHLLRHLLRLPQHRLAVHARRGIPGLDHRAHQLDAGDRRSLVTPPIRHHPPINYIVFASAGGTGNAEFAAIKLFKTNPLGTVYTPPTVSSFTTDHAVSTTPRRPRGADRAGVGSRILAAASPRWSSTTATDCWGLRPAARIPIPGPPCPWAVIR